MRIFIIGFMCSGKSVVGRELAQLTGRRFVDLDRVIEQRIGLMNAKVMHTIYGGLAWTATNIGMRTCIQPNGQPC